MNYTVGIIGLGNIGMTYDKEVSNTQEFLSHSKSFYHHPDFTIEFLLDINENLCAEARKRFPQTAVINNTNQIKKFPDVLVLAASSEVNISYLKQFKNHQEIKLFVVEKPFWTPELLDESWLSEEISNRVYVNYIRKYVPYFQNIKKNISTHQFGKCVRANFYYSKGLRNNGSHLIDLMLYLFQPKTVTCKGVFNTVNDYKTEDPSLSFALQLTSQENQFPVVFNALDERNYSVIEFDFFFEKGRIRIYEFGGKADVFSVKQDPLFPGYSNLLPDSEKESTSIEKYGYYLCNKVKQILTGEEANDSSIKNEFYIFETIQKIKNKL